jgi:hypothetical protein
MKRHGVARYHQMKWDPSHSTAKSARPETSHAEVPPRSCYYGRLHQGPYGSQLDVTAHSQPRSWSRAMSSRHRHVKGGAAAARLRAGRRPGCARAAFLGRAVRSPAPESGAASQGEGTASPRPQNSKPSSNIGLKSGIGCTPWVLGLAGYHESHSTALLQRPAAGLSARGS